MKTKNIILILIAALLVFGCSRQSAGMRFSPEYEEYGRTMGTANHYAMAPAGAAGLEGNLRRSMSGFMDMSYQYEEMRIEDNHFPSEASNLPVQEERKLVKTASLRIRVENLDTADNSVAELLRMYNGYAASSNIEENYRHYSLRIPAPQYDTFLTEIDGMGRLINRSENTEDVTLRYYDLEGRLESRRALLSTFQSYLGRANNMDEILSVEARIADLQREIDSTGTQLRNLANRVDYATIELILLGPVSTMITRGETLGERIVKLFNSFGGFLSTVAIVLFSIVIYGIPILLILALLFWILFGRIGLMKKLWRLVTEKKKTEV